MITSPNIITSLNWAKYGCNNYSGTLARALAMALWLCSVSAKWHQQKAGSLILRTTYPGCQPVWLSTVIGSAERAHAITEGVVMRIPIQAELMVMRVMDGKCNTWCCHSKGELGFDICTCKDGSFLLGNLTGNLTGVIAVLLFPCPLP